MQKPISSEKIANLLHEKIPMQKTVWKSEKIANLLHDQIITKLNETSKFFDDNLTDWYEENKISYQVNVISFDLESTDMIRRDQFKSRNFIDDQNALLLEIHTLICEESEIDVLFCEIDQKQDTENENDDYTYQSIGTVRSEKEISDITEKAEKIFLKTIARAMMRGFSEQTYDLPTIDIALDREDVLELMRELAIKFA